MLKLAVFVSILALCCAQPEPTPPRLPETFTSYSSVFLKERGMEQRGQGQWDRSMTSKSAVEIFRFSEEGHTDESERLELFSTHTSYHIMTDRAGKKECEARKIPEDVDFPNVWEWLEHAHFSKEHDPRTNKTYDVWQAHERDSGIMLYIDPMTPTQPAGIKYIRTGEERDIRFLSFVATEPPTTIFTVPPECNTPPPPPQRHH